MINILGGSQSRKEVMACSGGCIAGPSVISNPKIAAVLLKKYADAGDQPDGRPVEGADV